MCLTVGRALAETGRRQADVRFGVLGVGSIGAAALALARLGPPAEVRRRDLPAGLDDDLGPCHLILAAVSGGQPVDIAALAASEDVDDHAQEPPTSLGS
jgi:hypothetical protein